MKTFSTPPPRTNDAEDDGETAKPAEGNRGDGRAPLKSSRSRPTAMRRAPTASAKARWRPPAAPAWSRPWPRRRTARREPREGAPQFTHETVAEHAIAHEDHDGGSPEEEGLEQQPRHEGAVAGGEGADTPEGRRRRRRGRRGGRRNKHRNGDAPFNPAKAARTGTVQRRRYGPGAGERAAARPHSPRTGAVCAAGHPRRPMRHRPAAAPKRKRRPPAPGSESRRAGARPSANRPRSPPRARRRRRRRPCRRRRR